MNLIQRLGAGAAAASFVVLGAAFANESIVTTERAGAGEREQFNSFDGGVAEANHSTSGRVCGDSGPDRLFVTPLGNGKWNVEIKHYDDSLETAEVAEGSPVTVNGVKYVAGEVTHLVFFNKTDALFAFGSNENIERCASSFGG